MGTRTRAPARPMGAEAEAVFLTELKHSGNVLRAAAAAGVGPWTAYRRRGQDAGFAARWNAGLEHAGAGLAARSAAGAGAGAAARIGSGAQAADTVRRQSQGRPQLASLRAGDWTARKERDFLDGLSATANARAAAAAAGVSASGAWLRRRRVPAFAEAWTQAVDDGHARLEMLLMERGAALIGGAGFDGAVWTGPRIDAAMPDEAAQDRTARASFDPQIAMWLLKRRDQAKAGTVKRGAAWAREPSIEEVRAEILRKVEAMERFKARGLRRAGGAGGDRVEGPG